MTCHYLVRAAFAAVLLGMTCATLAESPECEPSRWGPDDEIGAANHITTESVRLAAQLVREGRTHPLGIVIDASTPAFAPRGLSLQIVQPGQVGGTKLDAFGYPGVYNDDVAHLWFGIGSQIDGLSHLGSEGLYYNCNDERDFVELTGVTRLGVHNVPPMVARGVVIDMAGHFGKPYLEAGEPFDAADLRAASEAQGVEIRTGDVVLFHTGWTDAKLASEPEVWVAGEPGITEDAATYLAGLDVMAVGADTWGLDVVPPPEGGRLFYGHVILLRDHGIYILETMDTGPLVEAGVKEFMFVLGQARIRGTVQMIINPVAMW